MNGNQVCKIGKTSDEDERAIIDFMKSSYGVDCWIETRGRDRYLMTNANPNNVLKVIDAVLSIVSVIQEIKSAN